MKFIIQRTRNKLPLPEQVTNIVQETDYDREMGYGQGEIEISSLEQLLDLSEKEGYLIISRTADGEPHIEIYDDYRE